VAWSVAVPGLICGVLAFWLLTWHWRMRHRVITAGVRLSGAVLAVKPGGHAGQYPYFAVLSPRLVVRYTWEGTSREQEVILTARSAAGYRPGQAVDLAIDAARPNRVVLADGGGQSGIFDPRDAIVAGMLAALLTIGLLIRFLIIVF
jgi:hypothetical protein